jgi:diguanylate cyclase (GGDEF)-like protein
MPGLAVAARPRPDRLATVRLIFLAMALLTVPVVVGIRVIQGRVVDGAFLIAAAALIVGLVMVRIGLLARQLHRSQAALRHMATHDPLTETLNRRAFTETLAAQLQTPRDCALIFCDLDGFKEVNDSYGHAVGDRLLIDVARRLRACVRQEDVVCRLGGDEFVILISGAGSAEVEAVRRRITLAFKEPFPDSAVNVAVTASIGSIVSDAAHRGVVTAEDLIEQADAAMYVHKSAARVRPGPERL